MEARVKKWGNSLGIRIPSSMAEDIGLQEDSVVDLQSVSGKLVISPKKKKYVVEELLAQVNEENCHNETDWGGPVGKEIW